MSGLLRLALLHCFAKTSLHEQASVDKRMNGSGSVDSSEHQACRQLSIKPEASGGHGPHAMATDKMTSQGRSVFCTVEEFTSSPFDFIIVGGGTAGLLLAARLSENERFQVGVLEAGDNKLEDPFVNVPNLFARIQNRSGYDWMLKSVPQVVTPTLGRLHD